MPATLTFAELVNRIERELADAAPPGLPAPAVGRRGGRRSSLRPRARRVGGGVRFALARAIVYSGVSPLTLAYEPQRDGSFRLRSISTARRSRRELGRDRSRVSSSGCSGARSPSPLDAVGELDLLGDDRSPTRCSRRSTRRPLVADASRSRALRALRRGDARPRSPSADGTRLAHVRRARRAREPARAPAPRRGGSARATSWRSAPTARSTWSSALLGILKAGAAYLPLNHEHPAARLEHQLVEAGARALVTQERAARPAARVRRRRRLPRPRRAELDARGRDASRSVGDAGRSRVYVIYTSGSTGHAEGRRRSRTATSPTTSATSSARLGVDGRAATRSGWSRRSRPTSATPRVFPALCSRRDARARPARGRGRPGARFARVSTSSRSTCSRSRPRTCSALLGADDAPACCRGAGSCSAASAAAGISSTASARSRACAILNHYGPTETTIGVVHDRGRRRPRRVRARDRADRPPISNTALLRARRAGCSPSRSASRASSSSAAPASRAATSASRS